MTGPTSDAALAGVLAPLSAEPLRRVLHAAWQPDRPAQSGVLLLWAEEAPAPAAPAAPDAHPFAASETALRATLAALAARTHLTGLLAGAGTWLPGVPLHLPAAADGAPAASPRLDPLAAPGGALRPYRTGALALDPVAALALLLRLPGDGPAADLRFWQVGARLAAARLAAGRYLPALAVDGTAARAVWTPLPGDTAGEATVARLAAAMPRAAGAAAPDQPPAALLADYLAATIAAAVRYWTPAAALPPPPSGGATPAQAAGAEWLLALLGPDPAVAAPPAALQAFAREYAAWVAAAQPAPGTPGYRVCFRLEPPTGGSGPWLLHFLLQATDDLSLLLPAGQVWQEAARRPRGPVPGGVAPAERLRAGLAGAARLFAPLADALRHPAPIHAVLDTGGAYAFLRDAGPALQAGGYGVLVPPWWGRPASRPAIRPRLAEAGPAREGAAGGGAGLLGADALVDFDWQAAVGDVVLDRAELERLVALKTPLVQVQGRWVELRPGEVEAALRFWARAAARPQPLAAVARLLLGEDVPPGLPLDAPGAAEATPAVAAALAGLGDPAAAPALPPPPDLQAVLRPYQQRGYTWLAALTRLGLGACLADDMGLGKTIQTLALLLHRRGEGPVLLVCPTSVVGNWRHEAARFAPALRVWVHQGPGRVVDAAFAVAAAAHDLVLTSYSLLARDAPSLMRVTWAGLVLDEAQNIKNPDAATTQAAGRLSAGWRVALTGTPVENRLDELWSILDFLNPGFLGARAAFRARYALPIEREADPQAAAALRARVGPLILRRLKTDRTIAPDLPEKLEQAVYCTLTREQVSLYEAAVRDGMARLQGRSGPARRGAVLRLLLQLKQIVDHPALFLGDGSALAGRSGKLARLTAMLEEVVAEGDKALVFTQYATMGTMLQAHLTDALGQAPLYLHGGVPRDARDALVAGFQAPGGPAVFILSLKAGGVGLNLTAAGHVFHYDRWWNPAVESQATDRAYRIGRQANVLVHTLIAAGTLDERIDRLIESKRALAAQVIGAGESESWLADLDDAALGALVAFDPAAGGDE